MSPEERVELFGPTGVGEFTFPCDPSVLFDREAGSYFSFGMPDWLTSSGRENDLAAGLPLLRMAFVDTGVLSSHPLLADVVEELVDFTGEGPEDTVGHGTTVALSAISVIQGARLRVLSAKVVGRRVLGSEDALVEGIRWAIEKKPDIVNLSLGVYNDRCSGSCAVCRAARAAVDAGITLTTAAGNTLGKTACPATLGNQGVPGVLVAAIHEDHKTIDLTREGRAIARVPYYRSAAQAWLPPEAFDAAHVLTREGRVDEAIAAYDRLTASDDQYARAFAYYNAAYLRAQRGDDEEAAAKYESALAEGVASLEGRLAYNLGALRERMGDTSAAEGAFRRAAASDDPEWATRATFKLARSLALRSELDEARALCAQVAASNDPELAPKGLVLLGNIASDSGDDAAAEAAYQAALQSGQPEAVALARQNLALLRDGRA